VGGGAGSLTQAPLKAFKQQVESKNVELPGHEAPPQEGVGLLHVRVFVRVTLPHVPDHVPSVQPDQPPATAETDVSTVITVCM
jgi:hypothetical protein